MIVSASIAAPCPDTRPCFAALKHKGERVCHVLKDTYKHDGDCPFCKEDKEITDGKRYPYDTHYGEAKNDQ